MLTRRADTEELDLAGATRAPRVIDLRASAEGGDASRPRAVFLRWLVVIVLVALGVRLGFVLGHAAEYRLAGDAWVYHHEGRFLAEGHWFISPWSVAMQHRIEPTADHPPLFVVMLALGDLVGLDSLKAQLAGNAVVGAANVALIGVVARRVAGARVALVAAVIAALYPGLWSWNGQLLSETLATFVATVVILLAYRFLDRPSPKVLAALAATVAVAGLARGELLLLLPLLVVPLVVSAYRRHRVGARLARDLAIAVAVVALVLGPWMIFNATRFKEPALLTTAFGRALDSGACSGFDGNRLGFWDVQCLNRNLGPREIAELDESELDLRYRDDALNVMRANPGRVPIVLTARVGRMFHVYDVGRQVQFDQVSENREWWVSGSALSTYYLVAVLAVVGVVVLRRRGRAVLPLVVPVAVAALSAMIAFGTTRYRASAEPAVVILAAVALVAIVDRWWGPLRQHVPARLGGHRDETVRSPSPPRLPSLVSVVAVLMLAVGAMGMAATQAFDLEMKPPARGSQATPELP